jgi:hypothetical protein
MLASLGIDAFRGGASLQSLEVADVRSIADLTRFNSAVEDKILIPCHSDPKFRADMRDRIIKAVDIILSSMPSVSCAAMNGATCRQTRATTPAGLTVVFSDFVPP